MDAFENHCKTDEEARACGNPKCKRRAEMLLAIKKFLEDVQYGRV